MKSIRPPSAAIFFMTNFYRASRGHGPLGPPGSATEHLERIALERLKSVVYHLLVVAHLMGGAPWIVSPPPLQPSNFFLISCRLGGGENLEEVPFCRELWIHP